MAKEGMGNLSEMFKNFVLNPNYGGGAFRRRIRLTGSAGKVPGKVLGELEDCNHGFRVTVMHENGLVTNILPEFPRIPFTLCDGAQEPLRVLIGCDINQSSEDINNLVDPLAHCTHLLDLTLLSIGHAKTGEATLQYDVEVTDQVDGVSELRVWRNEQLMHHWRSDGTSILWPDELKGKPLFKGFSSWVNEHFSSVAFPWFAKEAATVLQKGNLVSFGRFLDVASMAGSRASDETQRRACYTYSPERAVTAVRLADTVRDFTDTPEQLLKFL